MDIYDNNTKLGLWPRVIKIAGHFALFPGLWDGTSFSGTILQVPGRLASMYYGARSGSPIINPLRMRSRVTVVCLFVCLYVCMSVCYRSNCSSADLCHPNVVLPESARYLEGFWLVDFAKMALFKSYAVIYLAIGATIIWSTVRILLVSEWWHGNGDLWPHWTDSNGYVDNGGLRLICPSEPVSVYDWLKMAS